MMLVVTVLLEGEPLSQSLSQSPYLAPSIVPSILTNLVCAASLNIALLLWYPSSGGPLSFVVVLCIFPVDDMMLLQLLGFQPKPTRLSHLHGP